MDNTLRSTPRGIIKQLVDAYQRKDIDLYRDLFSVTQDFRFYVPLGFQPENRKLEPTCERITELYSYVFNRGVTCSDYWTYDQEMKGNQVLFEKAEKITLIPSPAIIDSEDIRYIVNGKNETTNVEIVMQDGWMQIIGPTFLDSAGYSYKDEYTIDNIREQVFYLERDPQNSALWVIQKWFDLKSIQ